MESRARGANRLLGFYEPRLLSARPRAGLTGSPSVVSEQLVCVLKVALSGSESPFEGPVIAPHAPRDAGELIGQGDRGHVVATAALNAECPGT